MPAPEPRAGLRYIRIRQAGTPAPAAGSEPLRAQRRIHI